jgi:segregation and condensation protein A
MARLTAQYLEYVEMMRSRQFELAAEYLLMAAVLLEIKSRMLLPKPKVVDAEEAGDPRAELVRRLLEYEQMKLAAQKLNALPQIGRDFQIVQAWFEQASRARLQQVNPDDLRQAWMAILARARVHQHHRVTREQLSVRARMTEILRRLQTDRFVEFSDLFGPEGGIAGLVVSFLAILELSRERLVEVTQAAQYGPIYVRIHDPDAEEAA